jgi:hypothetical protein
MRLRSVLVALVLTVAGSALAPPGDALAATYRACSGADRDNGITRVRVLRTTCTEGLAVARRTNAIKCFLNGNRCTHRFRGRSWTCTISSGASPFAVHCRAGRRHVRYRLG